VSMLRKRFAGVVCEICGKTYECDPKEPVEQCAKRHKMYKVIGIDLAEGIESSIYVCQSCYVRYLSKILSPYG